MLLMIHHIVLFNFKQDTPALEINKLAHALVQMKNKIPGIVKYVWGPSVSKMNLEKGYTHGFIMSFDKREHLDNYVSHSLHKKLVKEFVDPICENGLVFAIEEKEG